MGILLWWRGPSTIAACMCFINAAYSHLLIPSYRVILGIILCAAFFALRKREDSNATLGGQSAGWAFGGDGPSMGAHQPAACATVHSDSLNSWSNLMRWLWLAA